MFQRVRRHKWQWGLFLLLSTTAIIFALFAPRLRQAGLFAAPTDPVTAAWEKAQAAGSYSFSSDVVQITMPTAKVTNVGRSSRTEELHLTGQSDLRRQSMEMQLWSNGGSALQTQSGLGIKIADGKTLVRQGEGEWQEKPDFSVDGLAPQGNFLAYLVALRDVQAHAPEQRGGIAFTRYSFTLDGPTFALYVHEQMERTLRAKGELPPGMQLEVPPYYAQMTGDGELWIGTDGLPLRQILHLQFPPQKDEQVQAQMVIDFSDYGTEQTVISSQFSVISGWLGVGDWGLWTQGNSLLSASAPIWLLLAGLLGVGLVLGYRRRRLLHVALAIAVITSMVVGPVLSTMRNVRFVDTQTAKAAAQEEQQAAAETERDIRSALGTVDFNPHHNPLETENWELTTEDWELRTENWELATPRESLIPNLQTTPTDNGVDTDGDTLSDFVEQRVGTSPVNPDTDGDGLRDNLEVRGFTFGGKQWYLNPNAVDSNGDGQGDLLEWGMTGDGLAAASPQDTDGDGTPDLFDLDNDNDGVPDSEDQAPYRAMKTTAGAVNYFTDATPFKLTVNNLTANAPVLVDFQIRPKDPKHLWYAFNVLDWPQDAAGQMRDVDGKTFADVLGAQGSNPGANGANGDFKLTPMLEIRISGATTNLPSQSVLKPYNVTVNNYTADGATKLVYVPLSVITEEKTGQRVAFNGRMRYTAAGSWPNPHDIRLAWVVQGLVDLPCDPTDAEQVAQGCQSDGYIHNVQQVLQSYYDEWSLTGLSVREDRGASQAVIYEDPTVDTDKKDDLALWSLSDGLNEQFLGGQIDLNEVARRFNRTTNSGVSDTQRWAIPNRLRVEKRDYPTFDEAVVTTAMTETKRILTTQFVGAWQGDQTIKPLLLFAGEQRYRPLGLDGVAPPTGNSLVLDFSPGGQPIEVQTVAGVKATPYCAAPASTPTWVSCAADSYWEELEQRHLAAAALPADTDPDLKLGRMMATELYFMALTNGANVVTKIGTRSVSGLYSLKTDSQLETEYRLYATLGLRTGIPAIANQIVMARVTNNETLAAKLLSSGWKSFQRIGLGIPAAKAEFAKFGAGIKSALSGITITKLGLGGAAVVGVSALTAGLLYGLPENDLGQNILIKIASTTVTVLLSVVLPILDVVEAVTLLRSGGAAGAAAKVLGMSSELVGSSRVAGAIGAVLAVGITWGFFLYSMVSNHVSAFSPEFNRGLAEAIAATIYIIFLTLLSASVIGNIAVAIVAIIDGILTAICELGVDDLRAVPGLGGACFTLGTAAVKVIAYLFYNYDLMIDTSARDLVVTDAPKVTLADPSKGYVAGNSVSIAMPLNTHVVHKDPDPAQGLMIFLYEYFFSESNLRSSTVKYSLSKGNEPQTLTAARDEMTNAWTTEVDHVTRSRSYYGGRAAANPAPVTGITLQAGINQSVPYNLNMGYAYPAYECWTAPNPIPPFVPPIPVCYVRTFDGNSSTKIESLVYDVYPATLDGLMTLVSKGDGGVGLAWDTAFPSLKDADGDGLLSGAYNGLDPNDTLYDSDNDGLSDTYELERRQNGVAYSPISCDSDLDGLTDAQEMAIGSNPGTADSDNDGLKDGEEVWHQVFTVTTTGNGTTCTATATWGGGWDVRVNATSPFVTHVSSNPQVADSDGDGISDLAEKQLAESTCTAQEVAGGRACEGNPLKPVDSANRPFHPNVPNTPPVTVTVAHDDFDGFVVPGQTLRYTTTVVATAPLAPSVLDVTYPPFVTGAAPAPALLPFNPQSFTGSQTVNVAGNFTVPNNATNQSGVLSSRARTRLASSSGAAWVFDPVTLEPALGGFTTPLVARNTGLSATRTDRPDSYLLSALLSSAENAGGVGDIQAYYLPAGTSRAFDADNNNKNILRGINPPRSATNSRGDSLVVWDQVENCRVLNITLLSITQFAPDHVTSGIEPYITVRDSAGNQDVRVWNWTSVKPADLGVGTYSQGFPVTVNVCGDYTISMWESGNASGGDTLIRSQTLSQNTLYNLTLDMGDGTTQIYIDVNTPLRDRYTIQGALVGADGTVKKRFTTWPRITPPAGITLRSANPVVASNGDGFVVVYEQSQENANATAEHFVMSQGIDQDGNLLSSSNVSVGSVNYDVGRGLEQDIVWMGDRYRVAMKGVKLTTIFIADFAADGTRNGPFSTLATSSAGNNIFNSTPSLAWDPVSGRWALAYPLDSSIEIRRYPAVGSVTPDVSKSLSAFPNGVRLAWNGLNRGWLVASDVFFQNQANRQQFYTLDADLEPRATNATQTTWSTGLIPGEALACPAATALPVLDLRMEELPGATTFADSSGWGNNAVCGSASQCPTAGAPGGVDANNIAIGSPSSDYALTFNTNQYLRVPNHASLNVDANRSFTWLTWVKTTVGSPIMRKGLGGSNDLLLSITTDSGRLRMGFGNINTNTLTATGPDLRDNLWHQVAVTLDRATNTATLYVDGSARGSGNFTGSFVTSDALFIGSSNANGYSGALDNLQIYHSALKADTISALYNRTLQRYCVGSSPTATGNGLQWAKLIVRQPDLRGGAVIASNSVGLTVDADKPTVSLTSLQNNDFVQGEPGAPHVLMIGGTAADGGSGVAKVEVRVNNGPWQLATGAESWTYPLSVTDGIYQIETRATDSVGNLSVAGAATRVLVDATPPQMFLTAPGTSVRPHRNDEGRLTVPLDGTAFDNSANGSASGLAPALVQVQLIDGYLHPVGAPQTVTLTGSNWHINYLLPDGEQVPSDIFYVDLLSTDRVGNQTVQRHPSLLNPTPIRVDGLGPIGLLEFTDNARSFLTTEITSNSTLAGQLTEGTLGAVTSALSFVPLQQVLPYNDVVLLLDMEEQAGDRFFVDRSVELNHARCGSRTQCPTAGVAGRVGRGLSFANQYLRVRNHPTLNFDAQSSFSWQAWVKTNSTLATNPIMRKGLGGSADLMLSINSGGQAEIAFGAITGTSRLFAGPNLRDNGWHQIVVTLNRANNRAELYVDGVGYGGGTFGGNFTTPDDLLIGSSFAQGYQGALDQIAIFRHALSAAEVKALYDAASRPTYPVTTNNGGVGSSNWTLQVPNGLEGIYQIDLPAQDLVGNWLANTNLWRGIIDTTNPRVTLTAQATGQSYLDPATNSTRYELLYICHAEDFHLDEASFTCAGNAQKPPLKGFNNDPLIKQQLPDVVLLQSLDNSYTVWADSPTPTGSLTACDAYGHCTTVNASEAVDSEIVGSETVDSEAVDSEAVDSGTVDGGTVDSAAVAGAPNVVILAPTNGRLLVGTGDLAVTVAIQSTAALKTIELLIDGTAVKTLSFEQSANWRDLVRTITVPMPDFGFYDLSVRASDWEGQSTTANPVNVAIFTGAPMVTIETTALAPDSDYAPGSNIYRLQGTVNEIILDSIKVKVGDQPYVSVPVVNGKWSVAYPVQDPGSELTVTAAAASISGQSTTVSKRITVDRANNSSIETTFHEFPPTPSADSVTFQFKGVGLGDVELLSFECSLDGVGFRACPASHTLQNLSRGEHTMRVRAVDDSGVVDATPAAYTWTVGGQGAVVTISEAPAAETTERRARFVFTAPSGTLECALDGGGYSPCSTPQEYTGLAHGTHTFLVRAKQGNAPGTASRHTWRITNGAPVAQDGTVDVLLGTNSPVTLSVTDQDELSYQILQLPQHGVLLGVPPHLTYTPDSRYTGSDSFTFRASDGEFDSNVATVAITVQGVGSGITFGNCNGDGAVDAGDLSALVLEIFDGDGNDPGAAGGGSFVGGLGCDANGDSSIDAGDLSCTVLLIFNGPGACGGGATGAGQAASAALAVAAQQPVVAGETVAVPITLQSGGHDRKAAVFAVNFDPEVLTLDATDGDADGVPDAVALTLGVGQVGSAVYKAEAGRVEIALFGTTPNSAPLADGPLATLTLTANAAGSGEVAVTLTDSSLGDGAGQSVPVSLQDGSIVVTTGVLENRLYLPLIAR